MAAFVYKIESASVWAAAQSAGVYLGSPVDLADGFIHFSTADQVAETAAKHFAGRPGLVLIAVRPGPLGAALRYEPSRGGALFPHLYASLPMRAVEWVKPLPLAADGRFAFPALA